MAKERIVLVGPGRMGLAKVRHRVKEARKPKADGNVPDWTGLGTDLS